MVLGSIYVEPLIGSYVNGSSRSAVKILFKTDKSDYLLMPFIDYGKGWNNNTSIAGPESIVSAGLGFNWLYKKNSYMKINYGFPVKGDRAGGDQLQSKGVHFEFKLCLTNLLMGWTN